MKQLRLTLLASLVLGLSALVPLDARALSLSYDSATNLVLGVQVRGALFLEVGGFPAAGDMELTPAGGGEFDLTYSFSMFEEGNPLVVTGSYGTSPIPVTLRIDSISYQSAPERVALGPVELTGTVAGMLRGSLTVGTTTVPLSFSTNGPAGTDAQPCFCLVGRVDPAESVLGWEDPLGGVGLYSVLGLFSESVTVDGTTFTIDVAPQFQRLFYVPEPDAAALLALAGVALIALRARRRQLSSKPS